MTHRGSGAPARLHHQRDLLGSADRRVSRPVRRARAISNAGVLRVVDRTTFADDSLRVLRGVQFAARFDLTLDDDTREICQRIALDDSAGRAHLGRVREAAGRAAAVDRLCARARSRRRRQTVPGAARARRLSAGARVAPGRRRLGAHAAGDRSGAHARRRSRRGRSS